MARVTGETVIDRLHYLHALVQQADETSLGILASSEFGPMIKALLVVLDDHALDERGRCRRCHSWRPLWWRRQHPCRVRTLAYHHLVTTPPPRPAGQAVAASEAS